MFGVPIHKLIVHFPIALTILAAIYDSWALYANKSELHRATYGFTLWAAVGALAAVGTGLQLAQLLRINKGAVTGHAGFAIASTIVIAGLAGLRYSAEAQERKGYRIGWLALSIAAAALMLATAITGHRV
jgi:uncharacterized membrane protein